MYCMSTTRRHALETMLAAPVLLNAQTGAQPGTKITHYVRFRRANATSYGILDGATVREIRGDLFGAHKETGKKFPLDQIKLLYPCEPPKILAVGLNYKSHLGNRTPPSRPEMFWKPVTCLQNPEDPIVIPKESKNTHYEGEIVAVIGKTLRHASVEQARDGIFGVTCGNDVSERDWQNGSDKDLQWWRAKGADTFGPFGPSIVRGIDYSKLLLQTRLNGKVMQKQSTSDLLYDIPTCVSFISRYATLTQGDIVFTGTPGSTTRMSPGDIVEVEIEGIGILRNKVAAE